LVQLRQVQENGDANLVYCRIEDHVVHIFTKSFPFSKFEFLRKKQGACHLQGKKESWECAFGCCIYL